MLDACLKMIKRGRNKKEDEHVLVYYCIKSQCFCWCVYIYIYMCVCVCVCMCVCMITYLTVRNMDNFVYTPFKKIRHLLVLQYFTNFSQKISFIHKKLIVRTPEEASSETLYFIKILFKFSRYWTMMIMMIMIIVVERKSSN